MEGEWSMDCYMTTLAMEPGNSAYIQLKIGVSAPEIEVYIAGCCAGVPVILTKTIHVNSKNIGESRLRWLLDAILEDEEIGEGDNNNIRHRKSPVEFDLLYASSFLFYLIKINNPELLL
ncbi:uncharacterized protein At1g01500-like isoform X2 [Hibiscus syriacus]|uniref:uncharacterized protein At1g01500-like isoform X2 n=1 Tax=Hibiscus syriacus TaxID=106335 RepID=UPI0019231B56|nr:uncharacterized protein At1g01500-like isoform X2 [Hibiscus syriacus]